MSTRQSGKYPVCDTPWVKIDERPGCSIKIELKKHFLVEKVSSYYTYKLSANQTAAFNSLFSSISKMQGTGAEI